jgi:hypothetical protein
VPYKPRKKTFEKTIYWRIGSITVEIQTLGQQSLCPINDRQKKRGSWHLRANCLSDAPRHAGGH